MNEYHIDVPDFPEKPSPAELFFTEIQIRFVVLKKDRPRNKEVVMIAVLQDGNLIKVETLGYSKPEIIVFTGIDAEENVVQLVTHYSTCQVKLILVDRNTEQKIYDVKFGFETPKK